MVIQRTKLRLQLSSHADPMTALQKLTTDFCITDKMETISLDKGQELIAERMIQKAEKEGFRYKTNFHDNFDCG